MMIWDGILKLARNISLKRLFQAFISAWVQWSWAALSPGHLAVPVEWNWDALWSSWTASWQYSLTRSSAPGRYKSTCRLSCYSVKILLAKMTWRRCVGGLMRRWSSRSFHLSSWAKQTSVMNCQKLWELTLRTWANNRTSATYANSSELMTVCWLWWTTSLLVIPMTHHYSLKLCRSASDLMKTRINLQSVPRRIPFETFDYLIKLY